MLAVFDEVSNKKPHLLHGFYGRVPVGNVNFYLLCIILSCTESSAFCKQLSKNTVCAGQVSSVLNFQCSLLSYRKQKTN